MKFNKKKTVLTVIAVIVVAFVGSIIFFSTRTSQAHLTAVHSQGKIGDFSIDSIPTFITIRPGLRFKFDTGADYSSLTERDRRFLDSLGYKSVETTYPILGRNGVGDIEFNSKRYTVSLPIYEWIISTDSLGNQTRQCNYSNVNVIENVDFAPTDREFSVLGMDFLEKFYVELKGNKSIISLYFEEPDDFEFCTDLYHSLSPLYWPFLSQRYYVTMTVDNDTDDYFVDSGILHTFVKRPSKELSPDSNNAYADTAISLRGRYPATVDPDGWLKLGGREGKAKVSYFDNDEESHSFNPMNMFAKVDMLLAFPDGTLKFHK